MNLPRQVFATLPPVILFHLVPLPEPRNSDRKPCLWNGLGRHGDYPETLLPKNGYMEAFRGIWGSCPTTYGPRGWVIDRCCGSQGAPGGAPGWTRIYPSPEPRQSQKADATRGEGIGRRLPCRALSLPDQSCRYGDLPCCSGGAISQVYGVRTKSPAIH